MDSKEDLSMDNLVALETLVGRANDLAYHSIHDAPWKMHFVVPHLLVTTLDHRKSC